MAAKSNLYPLLLTLLLLGALVLLYQLSPDWQAEMQQVYTYARQGNEDALAKWFRQLGWWGPAAIIAFMIVQLFLIIIPSWLPMVVASVGYGMLWGTVIAIAGVAFASTVGYILGRSLGQPAIDRLVGKKQEQRLKELVRRYGFGIVVLFRLSPLLSTDAISILAGALHMSYWRYMLATLTGITPLAIAIAYFSRDLQGLRTGLYWLGGIGFLLYGIYVWLDLRRQAKINK